MNNIDLSGCFLKNDLYARLTELNKVLKYFYDSVSDTSWIIESVLEKKDNYDRLFYQTSNEEDNLCSRKSKKELTDAIKDLFKTFDDLTQWASKVDNSEVFSGFYITYKDVLESFFNEPHQNSLSQEVDQNNEQYLYDYSYSFARFLMHVQFLIEDL